MTNQPKTPDHIATAIKEAGERTYRWLVANGATEPIDRIGTHVERDGGMITYQVWMPSNDIHTKHIPETVTFAEAQRQ